MKRSLFPIVMIGALLEGCGSLSQSVELIPPRMQIREAPGQVRPARNAERVPLNLLIDVYNDSSEQIVLRRVTIRPGIGSQSGMKFEPVTRDFSVAIPSRGVRTVDADIVAWVELPNLDANTTTSVRAVAYFDSALGGFRKVFNVPIQRTASPR